MGWGYEIYDCMSHFTSDATCQKLVIYKIGPVVPEKKMLTHHEGQKPIAIGHLIDSGDLKSDFSLEIHFISIAGHYQYTKATNQIKTCKIWKKMLCI